MYVVYVHMIVQAHLFLFFPPYEEQGNRVTLWLIRKLMHRKWRQRHGSPSARSAGENNLHIGRLMDTFIGSTKKGRESRGRGRENHREERRGFIMVPDRCGPVTLLMRTSQIAAYQITHNHRGQRLTNVVTTCQHGFSPVLKTLVNNSTGWNVAIICWFYR